MRNRYAFSVYTVCVVLHVYDVLTVLLLLLLLQTPLLWWLALKALDLCFLRDGEFPASDEAGVQTAVAQLETLMQLVDTTDCPVQLPVGEKHIRELIRLNGRQSELHAVSSFIGGVASQEVIKLLTRQFIPMDNTFVYNGVCSAGAFYTF